jgi:hypothetical protein
VIPTQEVHWFIISFSPPLALHGNDLRREGHVPEFTQVRAVRKILIGTVSDGLFMLLHDIVLGYVGDC